MRFRKLDMSLKDQRQALVDTFINSIYLYDDKVLITFNYKEGTQTITFEEAAEAASKGNGSDLGCFAAPQRAPGRNAWCFFLLFFQKVKRLPPEGHSQSGSLFLFVTPSCHHRPSEPSSHGSSGYFWRYPKSRCTKGRSEWMSSSSESSVWCSGFQTQRWWKNFQKSCRFCRKNFL